jgi:hypothetical protein
MIISDNENKNPRCASERLKINKRKNFLLTYYSIISCAVDRLCVLLADDVKADFRPNIREILSFYSLPFSFLFSFLVVEFKSILYYFTS